MEEKRLSYTIRARCISTEGIGWTDRISSQTFIIIYYEISQFRVHPYRKSYQHKCHIYKQIPWDIDTRKKNQDRLRQIISSIELT